MSINRWIMRCNNNITVHNVVVNALSLDNEPLQQRNDVIPAVIHWITGRKDVIWVAFNIFGLHLSCSIQDSLYNRLRRGGWLALQELKIRLKCDLRSRSYSTLQRKTQLQKPNLILSSYFKIAFSVLE